MKIKMLNRNYLLSVFLCFCLLLISLPSNSGTLDDFETDATKDRSSQQSNGSVKQTDNTEDNDDCDSIAECIIDGMLRIFFDALFSGLSSIDSAEDSQNTVTYPTPSYVSENEQDTEGFNSREDSEYINRSLRPKHTVQLGISALQANDGVNAYAYHFTINDNRSLELMFHRTVFREKDPADEMSLSNVTLGMRLPIAHSLDLGAGVGLYTLSGNQSTNGLSFHLPINFYLNKKTDVQLWPTLINFNGTSVLDFDAALNWRYKYTGLRLGVRSLNSPHEKLSGPYIGILAEF